MQEDAKQSLIRQLEVDEGYKLIVYDDATGKPITKGSTLVGYPTIGVGRRLDFPGGLSTKEVDYLSDNDVVKIEALCIQEFDWFSSLSDNRQSAIMNMVFNLGLNGFEEFETFINLVQKQDWENAATDLLSTKWAREVGQRANRIASKILNG